MGDWCSHIYITVYKIDNYNENLLLLHLGIAHKKLSKSRSNSREVVMLIALVGVHIYEEALWKES